MAAADRDDHVNEPAPRREPHFEPFIPSTSKLRELTPLPLVVGTLLGMVFGASSLYLVLKVGLTVSASIPVAVISITLFRILSKLGLRNATILENNVVQTAGSAGESIAFGVGVTMPAILILGFDLELVRVALVAVLGSLLGIFMMIPLRRALIVEQHGKLKYPEGTACAEVLKAGASEESIAEASPSHAGKAESAEAARGGRIILFGFGVGLLYKTVMVALRGWKDVPERVFSGGLKAGSVSAEISPELLGVGYIIGPRIASTMCAGGVLAYLVLIPAIKFFGENLAGPLAPGTMPISSMGPHQIRGAYILYIGAGAVAAGGIISLARSLPTIWSGIRAGLRDFRGGAKSDDAVPRTSRDLSMKVVLVGVLALVVALTLAPPLQMNVGGAALIIVFGFLFVTVSSRLCGEIGSSSNPISGMTVATLLLTCGIFLALGWTAPPYYVTALSVGAIVCIAASNGGATSQDLKTGFLVGATPRSQQLAIIVGALASALILGPILLRLNDASTVYIPTTAEQKICAPAGELGEEEGLVGPQAKDDAGTYRVWHKRDATGGEPGKYLMDGSGCAVYLADPGINGTNAERPDGTRVTKFDAPKATLMSYIIKGILNQELPWGLVLIGVMIAVVLEMSGIPSLAFAVGVYLPLSSSTPILVGGFLRWLAERKLAARLRHRNLSDEELAAEADKSPGVMLASGYIAGGAIAGIVIAFVAGIFGEVQTAIESWAKAHNPLFEGPNADALSLVPFALLCGLLYGVAARMPRTGDKT